MSYRLAIVTTARPDHYLHLELASLLATGWSDPIDIFADAHIPDVVWPLAHHERFRFHRTSRRPTTRTANYAAALAAVGGDLLVLEDDIVFANQWQADVARIRAGLAGQTYILSLYWCRVLPPVRNDLPIVECPAAHFTCSQALLFQASYLPALREHFLAAQTPQIDVCVRDFAAQSGIPIYTAQPSLVQHWGMGSAVGSFFHQSPTFRGDTEEGHR
jgi:hypothetical protein